MPTVKERMKEVIQAQPDDASYEEILRELAFERMVDRGLEDFRQGRVMDITGLPIYGYLERMS